MAGVTEALNLKFHLISINLNLSSLMWLVATVLDSADIEQSEEMAEIMATIY